MRTLSFTTQFNGHAAVIVTPIKICRAFNPVSPPPELPPIYDLSAIWDTGATNSVITSQVVEKCGLKPIGMTKTIGVAGEHISNIYLVNIMLPNKVGFASVRVTEGKFIGGDILVGMNIICRGDMALTHVDGKTTFSFRMPSVERIDFVKKEIIPQAPVIVPPFPENKIGRNSPCPCGSRKKYKRCCGMRAS